MFSRLSSGLWYLFFTREVSAEEFIRAAKEGGDYNLTIVQQYLEENRDDRFALNIALRHNNTALIWATNNGHLDIVNALLACPDIDVHVIGEHGLTPLICAALLGHTAIANSLLARLQLSEITYRTNNNYTAEQQAMRSEHYDIARLIMLREHALREPLRHRDRPRQIGLTPQARLDRIRFTGEIPLMYTCPIDGGSRVMTDPITLSNGHIFERDNIKQWCAKTLNLETHTFTCPLTREDIPEREIHHKTTVWMKDSIDSFVSAEEAKDAHEKQTVKAMLAEMVHTVEIRAQQAQSSSLTDSINMLEEAAPHPVRPTTKRMHIAIQRAAFFSSQKRHKANNHDAADLHNNAVNNSAFNR